MIRTVSTTLLLYPEWIIWIIILFALANIITPLVILVIVSFRRVEVVERCDRLSEELATLRKQHRELRDRHHERRDTLSELGMRYDRLKREYDELWREHQETCDLLGPLLPDNQKPPGEGGGVE